MFKPQPQHKSVGAAVADCPDGYCNDLQYGHIAVRGIAVGILTSIVGVGGGFLIVPALVLLSGLSMKNAVGTLLSVVVLKSFAGFVGYAGAIAIVGSVVSTQLSHRLLARLRFFGWPAKRVQSLSRFTSFS